MVGLLAGLDLVEDCLGVLQAVGHGDADVVLANGHVDLAQSFHRADLGELQPVGWFARDQFGRARSVASITPPVVPKMSPAPLASPSGASKSPSGSKLKLMP